MAKRIKEVHAAIRTALGYDLEEPVSDVLKDWRERTSRVCKPCWELKYCPYGPLVEQLPLLPIPRADTEKHNEYLRECLETQTVGSIHPISEWDTEYLRAILDDDEFAWRTALHELKDVLRTEAAAEEGNPLKAIIGEPLPPLHIYRIPYDMDADRIPPSPDEVPLELRAKIEAKVAEIRERAAESLETGIVDNRKPLDAGRAAFFKLQLADYNPDDHPAEVPELFSEASCNIFGHICPVFFAAEGATETSEDRRRGRYIPFKTKMRVVRRDNHTCQECGTHLRDDEVEFDHIIPLSKGGSTEEHNIRLTCYDCNREKSGRVQI